MNQQAKQCQNCNQSFQIEPEDFAFYEKIQVPPPTFCPECRMVRRFCYRDNLTFCKRKCDFSQKEIFSVFPKSSYAKVYDRDIWWSDKWDPMSYGKDYDFNKPFFQQLKELMEEVPVPSRTIYNIVNSDYCSGAIGLKDCYLVFVATDCEKCIYGIELNQVKDSVDVTRTDNSEICYDSFALTKCYRTFYSSHCESCVDVYFSRNLANCSSCFGCINLRNKQYHIFNQPYSKEEYEKFIIDINGSYKKTVELRKQSQKVFLSAIFKFMNGKRNNNVSGEYIENSKNTQYGYYLNGVEDSKYVQLLHVAPVRNCYDYTIWGKNAELVYESSTVGENAYNIKFCYRCYINCRDLECSGYCHSSSNLFACIGLRNKQYCILNKQYTKEEYEELTPKIIEHMNSMPYIDSKGITYKYGEFFPTELSPFAYNETIAQEYFPLTKQQAIDKGYQWKDPEERNIQTTIKSEDLPDHIKDVKDDIIKEIIQCQHAGSSPSTSSGQTAEAGCNEQCTKAFKIIPQELEFYKKMNLPLPRLCPNCRHYQRLKQRNPLKLWKRQCQCAGNHSSNNIYQNTIEHFHKDSHCPNEFETTYSPDRPEIVYCEQCYNQEVA